MGTYYASADGKPAQIQGEQRDCLTLHDAVAKLAPGDKLILAAGSYRTPVALSCRGGSEKEEHITICGDGDVRFLGGPPEPAEREKWSQIIHADDVWMWRLKRCAYLTLENIAFENCWPCAILVEGGHDLVFKSIRAVRGQYVVYLRPYGRLSPLTVDYPRSVTLEDCHWVQDPEHLMWRGEVTWKAIKRQANQAARFNGALLGSINCLGDILVKNCQVSHAFNSVRLDLKDVDDVSQFNRDLRIETSRFDHIRDNAIEPEKHAHGLWVSGCDFTNVHAVFSLHSVAGGYWYIFGNTVLGTSKPGDVSNTGGKVFKFKHRPPLPDGPVVIVHNSFWVKSRYMKDGQSRNLVHANNLLGFVDKNQPIFSTHDNADPANRSRFLWHPSYDFRGDVSNHPPFPDGFDPDLGFAFAGHQVEAFLSDPQRGDWTPKAGSPVAAAGKQEPELRPRAVAAPMPGSGDASVPIPLGNRIGAIQADGTRYAALKPEDWPAGLETTLVVG